MRIKFCGAAKMVTGSKHLITTSTGARLLLDCGMFQGEGSDNKSLNHQFGFEPATIDYLILSHAHIDHSGLIPRLVKEGFNGPIYATPATIDLCKIMLEDSAHIQENDLKYLKKKKRIGEDSEALYTVEDARKCLENFVPVVYETWFNISDDIKFCFHDAGHIIGSASVSLEINDGLKVKKIFFSGDVGRYHDKIIKSPQPFPQADYVICETTYGNRLHLDTGDAEAKLLEVVLHTCVEKKGKLIIPAFSLGRTQEIVYALDRMHTEGKIPHVPVFVDSPLSTSATDIMRKHSESFNTDILEYMRIDPDPFRFDDLKYIQDVEESKQLNDLDSPCIIISASGMMEAGRIKHHLKNNISDHRNTILIVGYVNPNSLGGYLISGSPEVKIYGKMYTVKAEVEVIDSYSAHADYKELLDFLSCLEEKKTKTIFLVHGEPESQDAFSLKLKEKGFESIVIPELYETFDL